ncbi:MAG TPA: acyl-CoA dehydrogenase family protein [Ktedonobacteraceae bacterium]|nr:acyl-CoA dehydrogenase family protein [Ktedonobacteraceae bacterium]
MDSSLTIEQEWADIRAFVRREILPYADQYDREERTPRELIQKIAEKGYLGAILPLEWGGRGMDMVSLGRLHEEIGYGCSSVRSLLTVHSMVAYTILKWGSKQQKAQWLPRFARGTSIAAFALSEPGVGSDAKSVATTAVARHDHYVLHGRKTWITYGQIADVFLLFAQLDGKMSAFLVERDAPGLTMQPVTGMLGTRASMLAELRLEGCVVAKNQLVGGIGFGLAPIATSALDIGRYSVACGSVGIAQACLDAVLAYSNVREQYGVLLKEHQLIQHMITDMMTNVRAARLLCQQAGALKVRSDHTSPMETFIAKYFASTIAMKAASDAVQIHGAHGCSSKSPVQRYLRDAKVMEIIEGSSQIQQITIAHYGYQQYEQEKLKKV